VAIPWSTRLLNEIPEKLEKRALTTKHASRKRKRSSERE
jgi:hypothetical protein